MVYSEPLFTVIKRPKVDTILAVVVTLIKSTFAVGVTDPLFEVSEVTSVPEASRRMIVNSTLSGLSKR